MMRIVLAVIVAVVLFPQALIAQDRPNVIVLLADDFGYGDPSCRGGAVPTPNLDRLFREGIELETLLVYPVCSPTRCAMLTGRHPARVGVNPMVINPRAGERMNPRETVLAEVFKVAGYRTGIIGKWHLGHAPVSPNQKGFDYFYGFITAATTYLERPSDDDRRIMLNDKPSPDPGYVTDLFRDRAVQFIEDHKAEPFFLYVPFNAVHNPVEATKQYVDRVPESIKEPRARTRGGMVVALDDAVGAILKIVDEDEALARRTVVLFFADNGPTPDGSAAPLRGAKHSVYEGGVRTPSVVRWPGRIKPGSRTRAMLAAEDLFPTLLTLAGIPIPEKLALDGKDFSACLFDPDARSKRDVQHWLWRDCDAIRTTGHKLIRYANRVELYDLANDPFEKQDIAKAKPDLAAELERRLDAWEESVPVFPTHVPLKVTGLNAAPTGDVLEVRAKRDARSRQPEVISLMLGRCEPFQLENGDRLEFDVFTEAGSANDGWRVDAMKPAARGRPTARPAVKDDAKPGTWRRLTSGLANHAPRRLDAVWLVFEGREPAEFRLQVDNVVVRRADGSTVPLYVDGAPAGKVPAATPGYSGVSIRTVSATAVR